MRAIRSTPGAGWEEFLKTFMQQSNNYAKALRDAILLIHPWPRSINDELPHCSEIAFPDPLYAITHSTRWIAGLKDKVRRFNNDPMISRPEQRPLFMDLLEQQKHQRLVRVTMQNRCREMDRNLAEQMGAKPVEPDSSQSSEHASDAVDPKLRKLQEELGDVRCRMLRQRGGDAKVRASSHTYTYPSSGIESALEEAREGEAPTVSPEWQLLPVEAETRDHLPNLSALDPVLRSTYLQCMKIWKHGLTFFEYEPSQEMLALHYAEAETLLTDSGSLQSAVQELKQSAEQGTAENDQPAQSPSNQQLQISCTLLLNTIERQNRKQRSLDADKTPILRAMTQCAESSGGRSIPEAGTRGTTSRGSKLVEVKDAVDALTWHDANLHQEVVDEPLVNENDLDCSVSCTSVICSPGISIFSNNHKEE